MMNRYSVIILLMIHPICAKIYFTNKFLSIHAKKDISQFSKNEKNLNEVISKLETTKTTFNNKQFNATFGSAELSFNYWLGSQIANCIRALNSKKSRSNYEVGKAFVVRTKRNIIGEAISEMTGMQSPSFWQQEQISINKIKKVLNGEMKEIHILEHSMKDEITIVDNISSELKFLNSKDFETEKKLESFAYYLKAQHKIDHICFQGNIIADNLIKESNIIKEIKYDSRFNRPSQHLFPIEEIYKKVNEMKKKELSPVFNSMQEIEQIYSMTAAVTVVNNTTIFSLMEIPLVDFTYRYKFMPHPILEKKDMVIINNLQKMAYKPLDLFLCSEAHKTIRIISSRDLNSCQRTTTNSLVICKGRKLKQFNYAHDCKKLPNEILIELDSDLILMKSNLKTVQANCGNQSHKIEINSTYSILKISPLCKLMGKEFLLDKFTEQKENSNFLTLKPFEITSIDLELVLETKIDRIYNKNDLELHKLNISKLHKSVEELKMVDNENEEGIKDMNETIHTHAITNWSISGGLLVVIIIVIIIGCFACAKGK